MALADDKEARIASFEAFLAKKFNIGSVESTSSFGLHDFNRICRHLSVVGSAPIKILSMHKGTTINLEVNEVNYIFAKTSEQLIISKVKTVTKAQLLSLLKPAFVKPGFKIVLNGKNGNPISYPPAVQPRAIYDYYGCHRAVGETTRFAMFNDLGYADKLGITNEDTLPLANQLKVRKATLDALIRAKFDLTDAAKVTREQLLSIRKSDFVTSDIQIPTMDANGTPLIHLSTLYAFYDNLDENETTLFKMFKDTGYAEQLGITNTMVKRAQFDARLNKKDLSQYKLIERDFGKVAIIPYGLAYAALSGAEVGEKFAIIGNLDAIFLSGICAMGAVVLKQNTEGYLATLVEKKQGVSYRIDPLIFENGLHPDKFALDTLRGYAQQATITMGEDTLKNVLIFAREFLNHAVSWGVIDAAGEKACLDKFENIEAKKIHRFGLDGKYSSSSLDVCDPKAEKARAFLKGRFDTRKDAFVDSFRRQEIAKALPLPR